jgi:hypothetical protein
MVQGLPRRRHDGDRCSSSSYAGCRRRAVSSWPRASSRWSSSSRALGAARLSSTGSPAAGGSADAAGRSREVAVHRQCRRHARGHVVLPGRADFCGSRRRCRRRSWSRPAPDVPEFRGGGSTERPSRSRRSEAPGCCRRSAGFRSRRKRCWIIARCSEPGTVAGGMPATAAAAAPTRLDAPVQARAAARSGLTSLR